MRPTASSSRSRSAPLRIARVLAPLLVLSAGCRGVLDATPSVDGGARPGTDAAPSGRDAEPTDSGPPACAVGDPLGCPAGSTCDWSPDGTVACRPITRPGRASDACTASTECDVGLHCVLGLGAATGVCRPVCTGECGAAGECWTGLDQAPAGAGVCIAPCDPASPAMSTCSASEQCQWLSVDGRPRAGCLPACPRCLRPCTARAECADLGLGSGCGVPGQEPSEPRFCTESCDPVTNEGCSTGRRCVVQVTAAGEPAQTFCRAAGTRDIGQSCDDENPCREGAGCYAGACARFCALGTACETGPCAPLPLRGALGDREIGICPAACDPRRAEGCGEGAVCSAQFDGSTEYPVCRSAGSGAEGELCTQTTECAAGLLCTTGGVCARICRNDADCASQRCVLLASTAMPSLGLGLCDHRCDFAADTGCGEGAVCASYLSPTTGSGRACTRAGTGALGTVCNDARDCANALCLNGTCNTDCEVGTNAGCAGVCRPFSTPQTIDGRTVGWCDPGCDPFTTAGCGPGTDCLVTGTDSQCLRSTGDLPTGAACTTNSDCAVGHFCGPRDSGNVCIAYCRRATGEGCPAGARCIAFTAPVVWRGEELGACF